MKKPASQTDWKAVANYPGFTFVEIRLGTGRTHQIRVHLASIGHPVAGDRLYGAKANAQAMPEPTRFFLHSHRITIGRPSDGERITVVSPLPEDLRNWKAVALDRLCDNDDK